MLSLSYSPPFLQHCHDEYERRGTCHLFVMVEPWAGWRHVEVTEQRTMQDYAKVVRWLVDEAYPHAECIRLVQDNLNTHTRWRSTKRLCSPKLAAFSNAWSFITHQSTGVG